MDPQRDMDAASAVIVYKMRVNRHCRPSDDNDLHEISRGR